MAIDFKPKTKINFTPKTTPAETSPEGDAGLKGVATGAAKGLLSTLFNTTKLGEKILRNTGGRVLEKVTGIPKEQSTKTILPEKKPEALEPKGIAEKTGSFIEQTAEFAVPFSKVSKANKGLNVLRRVATEGITGGVVASAQEGRIAADSAILSAVFPAAGGLKNKVVSKLPKTKEAGGRVINSLIKPLLKDFSYGKNPGRAVAEEGIIANSLDDLAFKISQRRNEIGEQIGKKLSSPVVALKRLNLEDSLSPIDDAIREAQKAPRTNAALIQRLQDTKKDILGVVIDEKTGEEVVTRSLKGLSPKQAVALKGEIGNITKFTGNASDDKLVNSALKRVYGNIKTKVNKSAPGVEKLNERYADLTSARIATEYRDKIAQRLNLISLSDSSVGLGGALTTAIISGGAAVSSIIAGVSAAGLKKVIESPRVVTKVAAWLASSTKAERRVLFQKIPALKAALINVYGDTFEDELKK